MKLNRWKLIMALKSRLLFLLACWCWMIPVIGAGVRAVIKIIQMIRQGRNLNYLLDLEHNWWIYIFFVVTWLGVICLFRLTEKELLADLLFLNVEKQTDVPGGALIYPAKTDTYDKDYASEYCVKINRGKKLKPLLLYVNKKVTDIPKGAKYNLYYLKYSKLIVDVEVLEGGTKKETQVAKIPLMDPPVIPEYSKKELLEITKTYLVPFFGKMGCYIHDLYCREICATEVIPIHNIYGKKFRCCVDLKMRDNIKGIKLEVTDGIHKKERFLLDRSISTYWNCFPMCASLPPRFRGEFRRGEKKMKAVRLYYLKHSRVVVKMDVLEHDFASN